MKHNIIASDITTMDKLLKISKIYGPEILNVVTSLDATEIMKTAVIEQDNITIDTLSEIGKAYGLEILKIVTSCNSKELMRTFQMGDDRLNIYQLAELGKAKGAAVLKAVTCFQSREIMKTSVMGANKLTIDELAVLYSFSEGRFMPRIKKILKKKVLSEEIKELFNDYLIASDEEVKASGLIGCSLSAVTADKKITLDLDDNLAHAISKFLSPKEALMASIAFCGIRMHDNTRHHQYYDNYRPAFHEIKSQQHFLTEILDSKVSLRGEESTLDGHINT